MQHSVINNQGNDSIDRRSQQSVRQTEKLLKIEHLKLEHSASPGPTPPAQLEHQNGDFAQLVVRFSVDLRVSRAAETAQHEPVATYILCFETLTKKTWKEFSRCGFPLLSLVKDFHQVFSPPASNFKEQATSRLVITDLQFARATPAP